MKVRQTWAYKLCYLVGVIGLLVTLPSCDALDDIIGPTLVTVRLVNTGDFAVDVELYYHDEQLTPEILLTRNWRTTGVDRPGRRDQDLLPKLR